jgi:hypothetical protein
MSVFYDDRGRDRDYPDDVAAQAARRARWGALRPRRPHQPAPARPRAETKPAPLWGLSYDRAEGVIQLLLAFALVGGATALLSSSQFSGAPAAPPTVAAAALTAPAPAAAPAREAAVRPDPKAATKEEARSETQPEPAPLTIASVVAAAAPEAAASTERAAMDAAALFDSRPIAGPAAPEAGPRPLPPPNAEAREKLAVPDAAPAPAVAAPAAVEATPDEAAPAHEAKAAEGGRLTKCYLKISGRPTENASCRIRQSDKEVVFDFDGNSLVFAHQRGRVWSATMGGRSFGKVYQNAHKPCWGARGSGFYACDNT